MKSKKVIAIALTALMCLSTACSARSAQPDNTSDETTVVSQTSSQSSRPVIAFDPSQKFELYCVREQTTGVTMYTLYYNSDYDTYSIYKEFQGYDESGACVEDLRAEWSLGDGGLTSDQWNEVLDRVISETSDWCTSLEEANASADPSNVHAFYRINMWDNENGEIDELLYMFDDDALFEYLDSLPVPEMQP